MIHFFKQKNPFLRDLIPDNFVDIHSHLLPGIDDGAISIENTTCLIKGLENIGIKKFITTPHVMGEVWKNTSLDINKKLSDTISELELPKIKNRLKAAAEYMIDEEFRELFKKEQLLTLKENYVLIEISHISPSLQLFNILFELQSAGYQPILAHPERYNFYHHSLEYYKKLKNAGCLFQLNMLSATGYYGEHVAKISNSLIKEGLIDFIGSDVHHIRHLEALCNRIVLKNYEYLTPIFQNNSIFKF